MEKKGRKEAKMVVVQPNNCFEIKGQEHVICVEFHKSSCNSSCTCKKPMPTRSRLFSLVFLAFLFFIYCSLVSESWIFNYVLVSDEGAKQIVVADAVSSSACSSVSNGSICCDRSSLRSDICYMRGDIRTHSVSTSVYLYSANASNIGSTNSSSFSSRVETIRPYTRKWETNVMNTITTLKLVPQNKENVALNTTFNSTCQVEHLVPAIFFSTSGYTGNVYHEFNDGILPLYITSRRFNRRVVFVILDYHSWWVSKYGDILAQLSDYPPIDFSDDHTMHCFPQAIVGLEIHDELAVKPSPRDDNRTIQDFRGLLDNAYAPRIRGIVEKEKERKKREVHCVEGETRPRLVVLSRNGSRSMANEGEVVEMAKKIGFCVEVVRPKPTTELAKVYRILNSSDVMLGVHGAAMTHLLFMRPRSVFIQVVPLGTKWAANTYYGDPAKKLGLRYVSYNILPRESSLYEEYDRNDPVLRDPESINQKGWQETKRVYLDTQRVRVDLKRFRMRLTGAYEYTMAKRRKVQ